MPLTNAHDVIKRIIAALFTSEERRLEKVRNDMVAANKALYPNRPHDGFLYLGKPYDTPNLVRGLRKRVSLHQQLAPEMDAYLKDEEQVWTDRHLISQMLFVLLQPCSDNQDVRDALPNCLADTMETIKRLSRTREEAFTIRNNPRTFRQYQRILPRIEFYAAARLLY